MSLPLSILCQSPIGEGRTAIQAVHETVQLAKDADELGYHRFWVAEHHSDRALASASPEVLISHIASVTDQIRVGAGGVLLPHYSPYKVAEQFHLLEALFPGRVDLGLGRAGGTEGQAAAALRSSVGRERPFAHAAELLRWFRGGDPRWSDTFVSPPIPRPPELWMLGTSPASAEFAGTHGLPYSFGGFIDPRQVVPALTAYHQHFKPSVFLDAPKVNLGWVVFAASTEAEAQELTSSSERWFVETFLRGRNPTFPSPAAARGATYSLPEQLALGMRREASCVGTPEQVLEQLHGLAKGWMVDELTLVTITWDPEARRESYRLLAKAAGLS